MDEYLQLQKDLVDEMRKLGAWFQYDDRLSLFWLRNNIGTFYGSANLDRVITTLDRMVELRKEGKEPKHENGKYIFGNGGW